MNLLKMQHNLLVLLLLIVAPLTLAQEPEYGYKKEHKHHSLGLGAFGYDDGVVDSLGNAFYSAGIEISYRFSPPGRIALQASLGLGIIGTSYEYRLRNVEFADGTRANLAVDYDVRIANKFTVDGRYRLNDLYSIGIAYTHVVLATNITEIRSGTQRVTVRPEDVPTSFESYDERGVLFSFHNPSYTWEYTLRLSNHGAEATWLTYF